MTKSKLLLLLILMISSSVLSACSGNGTEVSLQHNYSDLIKFYDNKSIVISSELSDPCVTAFAEDSLGYIWIGTERGLNRYNAYDFHQYFYNEDDTTSLSSDHVKSLYIDKQKRLWVGLDNGLCLYKNDGTFHRIPSDKPYAVQQIWQNNDGRLFANMTESLYEYNWEADSLLTVIDNFDPVKGYYNKCFIDRDNNIWSVTTGLVRCYDGKTFKLIKEIYTGVRPYLSYLGGFGLLMISGIDELITIDTNTQSIVPTPKLLSDMGNIFKFAYSESDSRHFVCTDKDIFFYNRETGETFTPDDDSFPFEILDKEISAMFFDSKGNIWIGTPTHGFIKQSYRKNRFNSSPTLTKKLMGHKIVSISSSKEDDVFFIDSNKKLIHYTPSSDSLTIVDTGADLQPPYPQEYNAQILVDQEKKIWVLDNGKVLHGFIKNNRLNVISRFQDILSSAVCIAEDNNGTIYIGTDNGGLYQKKSTDKSFVRIPVDISGIPIIYSILPLKNGDIILGLFMNNPLYVDTKSWKSEYIPISHQIGRMPRLITSLVEDKDNRIWIGTSGAGIFRYDVTVPRLERIRGISSEEICSIVIDDEDVSWISTLYGINRYNIHDGSLNSFFSSDGLGGNRFSENASELMPNGDVVFGGLHGISIFNPKTQKTHKDLDLVFDDLILGGQIVQPIPRGCITSSLSKAQNINLSHKDNNFIVTFSSLDFNGNNHIRYSYKLEGFNDDWVDIRNSREAHFSNIPPGDYVLKIKATDNNSNNNTIERSISVHIEPPVWDTWWAKAIYAFVLIILILAGIKHRNKIEKQRREAELLAFEKEQEKHTNEMNLRFFTNVSHEFRTPLTMIAGPLTLLEKIPQMPESASRLIHVVKSNSNRMLRLVNQLLDFSNLENDTLKLQISPTDVIGLINQTIDLFEISIEEKNINFRKFGLDGKLEVLIDSDKLEKVVANLISNALKFTDQNGEIICKLDYTETTLYLEISDDGIQIPEDSISRIFDRYYQVGNHKNYGTGIGLYYSKRLIEMQNGSISCTNRIEGGVSFNITLPAKKIDNKVNIDKSIESPSDNNAEKETTISRNESSQTILLIDDDPEVINYLKNFLSSEYNIKTAYSASDAISILNNNNINLIVSDVAMPWKDGYALCREIKNELTTSHIPIILVTAKTTPDEQIEGLNCGADAYVTKPFNPEILKALICSQLENRKRLQHSLGMTTSVDNIKDDGLNDVDRAFLKELYKLMEDRIGDSELDVNKIGDIMLISRSKLYYKIKSLTGDTPSEFFKKYKLQRAMELFKNGKTSVSEVSEITGFTNQTIFSRNFKKQFGMTPSEFIKSLNV